MLDLAEIIFGGEICHMARAVTLKNLLVYLSFPIWFSLVAESFADPMQAEKRTMSTSPYFNKENRSSLSSFDLCPFRRQ